LASVGRINLCQAKIQAKQTKSNKTSRKSIKNSRKKSIKQGQNGLNKISADDAVSGKFYFL